MIHILYNLSTIIKTSVPDFPAQLVSLKVKEILQKTFSDSDEDGTT